MKKYLLLGLLVFLPLVSRAEVPSGVFGFQDGKYYDQAQSLKYICFLDGNCYDMNQKFAFQQTVKEASIIATASTTKYTLLDVPAGYPRALDDSQLSSDFYSVTCLNVNQDSMVILRCINQSQYDIQIKQVLFNDILVSYNGDYESINNQFNMLSNGYNNLSNFKANSSNTSFYRTPDPAAKVVFTLPSNTAISKKINDQESFAAVIKSLNLYASLVLVNINGKDVVYKVN